MTRPLAVELGDVVSKVLEQNPCNRCGATLTFAYAEKGNRNLWLVYAKCPNGCFDKNEYNLFKIQRVER